MGSIDAATGQVPAAVGAALAELTRAVDVLQAESLDNLDDAGVLAVLRALETQRRRMPTVDHRLITELECRSVATRYLSRGTAGLLVELWHVDVGEARARVWAAEVLGPRTAITGEGLEPVYPAVASAQAAGTLSEKHTRIITDTIGALPHSLDADSTARAEQSLLGGPRPRFAPLGAGQGRRTPHRLPRPRGHPSDDRDRAARRGLSIGRQRGDGMSPITGLLDPATRALVDAAFSCLAWPGPSPTGTPRIPARRRSATMMRSQPCAATPWPPAPCPATAGCRPPWCSP